MPSATETRAGSHTPPGIDGILPLYLPQPLGNEAPLTLKSSAMTCRQPARSPTGMAPLPGVGGVVAGRLNLTAASPEALVSLVGSALSDKVPVSASLETAEVTAYDWLIAYSPAVPSATMMTTARTTDGVGQLSICFKRGILCEYYCNA